MECSENVILVQLLGDINIQCFVGMSHLQWTAHVNGLDCKRKVSEVFNNNLQGSQLKGRRKHRWWNCVQTDINRYQLKDWKERSENELTGRSPLRRRKAALDCSAI
jgi:hypothetical protein